MTYAYILPTDISIGASQQNGAALETKHTIPWKQQHSCSNKQCTHFSDDSIRHPVYKSGCGRPLCDRMKSARTEFTERKVMRRVNLVHRKNTNRLN